MEIKIIFPGGKRVDAIVGEYVIRTDQPRESGGEGSAPTPYTYFLAALAACAGHYARSYLEAHGEKTHRLARLRLRLRLPEGIDPRHRQAAKRAAASCAVKRTIDNPPEFVIELL